MTLANWILIWLMASMALLGYLERQRPGSIRRMYASMRQARLRLLEMDRRQSPALQKLARQGKGWARLKAKIWLWIDRVFETWSEKLDEL